MLIGSWDRDLPALPDELVIIAPHPDDEVLGCGMLMRWFGDRGCAVSVVACTDGEASHRRSRTVTPEQLRQKRLEERAQAFRLLGVDPQVTRLQLPDGRLADAVVELADAVSDLIGGAGAVIAPWRGDDHPDHVAATRAATEAAGRRGITLWLVPIWGKVRRSRPYDGRVSRLTLSAEARDVKAAAAAAFVSQLQPVGPGPHDGPVVRPSELDAMLDGEEVVLW